MYVQVCKCTYIHRTDKRKIRRLDRQSNVSQAEKALTDDDDDADDEKTICIIKSVNAWRSDSFNHSSFSRKVNGFTQRKKKEAYLPPKKEKKEHGGTHFHNLPLSVSGLR